jgi:hypothetical protein
MQFQRVWLTPLISSLAALAAPMASAAGFGASGSGAVLGQPLDFVVQVRLDPGEPLSAECVTAEVTAGEHRVPPSLVRALVEAQGTDSARIRVLTLQGIDEPVIGINLGAGCASHISRRFVVLADPPEFAIAPAVLPAVPAQGLAAAAGAEPAMVAAPVADDASAAPALPAVQPPPAPAPESAGALARAERRARARQAAAAAPRAEAAVPRAAAAARPQRAAPATEPRAHLKLDLVEPAAVAEASAVEQAIEAVAQAASAARASALAASAAAERIATLERTVEQLQGEARSSQELAAEMRRRLVQAEGSSRWLMPLLVAAAALAALAAWLAWTLSRLQNERQRTWQAAVSKTGRPRTPEPAPSQQTTVQIPVVASEIQLPAVAAGAVRSRAVPAWPPAAPAEPSRLSAADTAWPEAPAPRTEVLPPNVRDDEGAPRDVTIEELIDLEQQAEFFVVLGQDEAAIELLAEHLRSTGGGSPLPYLKLLEIHHRRGDRAAYERLRTSFNQRFNAYAPEWGAGLQGGRALEDYSGVLPRLQQVWGRPLDAMAELEALLFRKSRGELFDLPAYREVLFLYSLARDRLDHESVDSGNVDLLLPLADGSEFGSTAPTPFLGLEPPTGGDRHESAGRLSALVDFDPSVAERPTSIFDPLDDTPPGPR